MEGKAGIQQYVHECSMVSSAVLSCLTCTVFNGSLVPLSIAWAVALMSNLESMNKEWDNGDLLNRLPVQKITT